MFNTGCSISISLLKRCCLNTRKALFCLLLEYYVACGIELQRYALVSCARYARTSLTSLLLAPTAFSNAFMTSTRIPQNMQDDGDEDFELIRSALLSLVLAHGSFKQALRGFHHYWYVEYTKHALDSDFLNPASDWIQDSIVERNRRIRKSKQLHSIHRGPRGEVTVRWIWVQLKRILDAGQSWLVVSLVGVF